MTLGEKFGEIWVGRGTFEDDCEKIADEYAIDFLIWASQFALQRFDKDRWQVLGLMDFGFTKTVSTREILEEYKKEKGL
jgi:hypothetical protein